MDTQHAQPLAAGFEIPPSAAQMPVTPGPSEARVLASLQYVRDVVDACTRAAREIFGYATQDLVGQEPYDPREKFPPEKHPEFKRRVVELCEPTAAAAGMIPRFQREWVEQHVANMFVVVHNYTAFILNIAEDQGNTFRRIEEITASSPLHRYMMEKHPLFAGVSIELLARVRDPDSALNAEQSRLERPLRGWYLEFMALTESTFANIDRFFSGCERRCRKTDDPELPKFLAAWRDDICLSLIESVAVGNALALSLRLISSPHVIYWPFFPRPQGIEPAELHRQVSEITPSHMYHYLESIFSPEGFTKGKIPLPTAITLYDFLPYLRYLDGFWSELNRASLRPATIDQRNTSILHLGDFADICCNVNGDADRQARIAIRPHPLHLRRSAASGDRRDYHGFDLRVDRERNGKLGFDFGEIGFEEGLRMARLGARHMNELPRYEECVDAAGNFYPELADVVRETFWGRESQLPRTAHAVAAMAATLASGGVTIGMRRTLPVSYHFRDQVSHEIDARKFPEIVRGFRSLMIRAR